VDPINAIQTATTTAAELLNMKGKIGELIPGAFADIIAMQIDPTKDIKALQNVKWVMKGGVVYKDVK